MLFHIFSTEPQRTPSTAFPYKTCTSALLMAAPTAASFSFFTSELSTEKINDISNYIAPIYATGILGTCFISDRWTKTGHTLLSSSIGGALAIGVWSITGQNTPNKVPLSIGVSLGLCSLLGAPLLFKSAQDLYDELFQL